MFTIVSVIRQIPYGIFLYVMTMILLEHQFSMNEVIGLISLMGVSLTFTLYAIGKLANHAVEDIHQIIHYLNEGPDLMGAKVMKIDVDSEEGEELKEMLEALVKEAQEQDTDKR